MGTFIRLMHGSLLRSASWLQACKAADDLKANLEEEYVAVRTFIVEFCKCMDYIQHAKMLVSGCEYDTLLFPVLPGNFWSELFLSLVLQMLFSCRAVPSCRATLLALLNGGCFVFCW